MSDSSAAARSRRVAALGGFALGIGVIVFAWQSPQESRSRERFEERVARNLSGIQEAWSRRTNTAANEALALSQGHAVLRTILSTASLAEADLGFPNFQNPRDALRDANLRLRSLLPSLPGAGRADVFLVTNAQGRLVYSKAAPEQFGADLMELDVLHETLASGRGLDLWTASPSSNASPRLAPAEPPGALYQVIGRSVEFDDEVHGVVVIGDHLDRGALDDLEREAGLEILVRAQGGGTVSTLDAEAAASLSEWTSAPGPELQAARDGRAVEWQLGERRFLVAGAKIVAERTSDGPELFLLQPLDESLGVLGTLSVALAGIGALVLCAALIAGRCSNERGPPPSPEEEHARIKEIFLEAAERPVEEREAFLDQACRDAPNNRREVEQLLSHHDEEPFDLEAEPISSASRERFETGSLFANRYRIVSPLGKGGAGEVLRADDLTLGVPVALKFLRTEGFANLEGLLNEVRLARQVSHPNVCRVFDVGEAEGETFFSMEYIDGEDLASQLARIGRLPAGKTLELARELCGGLAAAHEQGVLHRDLKPGNIMVDARGRARIVDFGIAIREGAAGALPAGTPAYMAPEQLSPGGSVTEQTDLYALGLVLYELVTGRPVFDATGLDELRQLHRAAGPAPPSRFVPEIDPRLEAVILQALREDPAERPASADAMARALYEPTEPER